MTAANVFLESLSKQRRGQMSPEQTLRELGIELPPPPQPIGAYVPTVTAGGLTFTSGQLPLAAGELKFKGTIGTDLTAEQGYQAARVCLLNGLAAVRAAAGSLDRVKRVVKVVGFVNAAAGFNAHPQVLNGASDLLVQIFGEAGRHARSAVGASGLPLGAPVEIELIVEISP